MPKRKRGQVSESESIKNDLENVKLVKTDEDTEDDTTETPDNTDKNQTEKSSPKNSTKSEEENSTQESEPEAENKENAVPEPSSKSPSKKPSKMLRFFSWNVNGARALVKKKEHFAFLEKAAKNPEVQAFGLQETKCDDKTLPKAFEGKKLGFNNHYLNSSATKKGYSGTCIYTREKPLSKKFGMGFQASDQEGRTICVEFEKFYFITCYIMNSGQGLKRLDERTKKFEPKMRKYLKELDAKKPIIYCGDLNVACSEIELANPKSNYNKTSGYTQAEIDEFNKMVDECKLVDSFRMLYPDKTGSYTYWGYRGNARARNVGWRLDYFMVSDRIKNCVVDVVHHAKVEGSDHCPIELVIDESKI